MQQRLRVPEYVSWFPLERSVVLVDRRSGRRSELEDAAAFLWEQAASGTATEASLVSALATRAEEGVGDVRDYVQDWVRSLQRSKLIYPVLPAETP